MNRPAIRLIDVFGHWRDQHLYDLQVVIRHLANKQRLTPEEVRQGRVTTTLFTLDDHGRPAVTRRETSLGDLLRRYTGLTGTHDSAVPPLLHALRLERERRLRYLLHSAQLSLSRLLDPAEIQKLRALPLLAEGPSAKVAKVLRAAVTQSPRALEHYPATTLARLLGEDSVQDVLAEINTALGWEPEARATALLIPDLALLTLVLPWALDPAGDCAGFDFYAPALAGVSVAEVLAALRAHLMPSLEGCPEGAFNLVRYLLARHAPAELNVLGLPPALAWASSVTWVLLSHGVTLAEVIMPGGSEQLSFNDVLELPAKLAAREPGQVMSSALAAALVPGLSRWTSATQYISELPLPLAPESAARAFLNQLRAMDKATIDLQQKMPTRLEMVRDELKARGIAPDMRFVEATDRVRQSLLSGGGITATIALGTGLAAGETPAWVPALVVGHDGRLHEPWVNAHNIPNIPARFDAAFTQWKDNAAHATGVLIERLLSDLPLADRLRLEAHPVILCKLNRRGSEGGSIEQAHYGFVLYVSTAEGAFYYAVVPSSAWCQLHADLARTLPAPRSGDTTTSHELPFDWEAFAHGGLPQPNARFTGWLEPFVTLDAARHVQYHVFSNARSIARQCRRQVQMTLGDHYLHARANLPGETATPTPEAIKVLVPFWSSFESIRQGFEEKRGWLVVLGLLGVGLELVTLGAWGRLSALSIRFVTLALRKGARQAVRQLGPRLRSAARDALESLLPPGADPQAPAPVADLGLLLSLRRAHGSLLSYTARQLGSLDDARRGFSGPALLPLKRPSLYVRALEDDTLVLVGAGGPLPHPVTQPRLIDLQTFLPYGPNLDVLDDTGRLGRLPKELPVTVMAGRRYVPDPAPSLPKRWIGWGEETWLECSGRYYRLREATSVTPAVLEQAPAPFARPQLKSVSCRLRRALTPLRCGLSGERVTEIFTELTPGTSIEKGAVTWFDERKVIPAESGSFVDGRRLIESRQGRDQVVETLTWDRYRDHISARRVAGNDIFLRIEITVGLIDGVEDRRLLSAVQVMAKDTGALHIVTCVDEGVFYQGKIQEDADTFTLDKLPEGNSPRGNDMSEEEELKFIFDGCWDANRQLRNLGEKAIEAQLKTIEETLAQGVDLSQTLSRRFKLTTTPAQAALFAKYPRRSFSLQTRELIASDYTYPITSETPVEVRSAIATHLNRLTKPATAFDAQSVLDPVIISNARPKGRNIAFLALGYGDQRPSEVYFSVSGERQRKSDVDLGKLLMDSTSDNPYIAEDGTRYINCRGAGSSVSTEDLLHLPDLSQPGNLNTGDINDRRLDSERNILAYIVKAGVQTQAATKAVLFTRLPTCDSCTTLITQFRERFPAAGFNVYEGPKPAPRAGSSSAPAP